MIFVNNTISFNDGLGIGQNNEQGTLYFHRNNFISNQGHGLVSAACGWETCNVTHNNFIDNNADPSQLNVNEGSEKIVYYVKFNYYSEWNSPDENNDGFVDEFFTD